MKKNNKVIKSIDPELRKGLASTLYNYRVNHSLSQEQLAHLIGTSVFSVCRWERGRHYPSQTTLKLMKMLGVL